MEPTEPQNVKTLLFLCTGNYYRSRLAEILFNWKAKLHDLPWRAISRGFSPSPIENVGPISKHTVAALRSLNIPLETEWRDPTLVTEDDLREADHIIAIKEDEHRPMMEAMFPEFADSIEYWDVHDLDCAEPEETVELIELKVSGLIYRLSGLE